MYELADTDGPDLSQGALLRLVDEYIIDDIRPALWKNILDGLISET